MFELIITSLKQWNVAHGDRAKLQHAIFTSIVSLVILAGLVSLLNIDLGRQILAIASLLGAVFIINAVAWALLQTFVLSHLKQEAPKAASAPRTRQTKNK